MTPEEVTHSPGTMILAPLTRDSRQRMPEIVPLIQTGLERRQADAQTREMLWDSVYWSMGLICDLDEAHRALGDAVMRIHASRNYLCAKGQAFLDAYSPAQSEGALTAARNLVLRQAARRFGALPGAAETLAALSGARNWRRWPGGADRCRLGIPVGQTVTASSFSAALLPSSRFALLLRWFDVEGSPHQIRMLALALVVGAAGGLLGRSPVRCPAGGKFPELDCPIKAS